MEEGSDFELAISATIYGIDFSPRKLSSMSQLVFEKSHEKGEVFHRKTYTGVYQNGSAALTVAIKSLSERNSQFDKLLDLIVDNYAVIQASGATSIYIQVAVFKSIQGNWEATPAQVQKIASFNGSLAITYYRGD